jgi:PAS domain-containing protein
MKRDAVRAGTDGLLSALRTVLETLSDPVTVQDLDFTFIYQNQAMREAFGDHLGEKCHDICEHRPTRCSACS